MQPDLLSHPKPEELSEFALGKLEPAEVSAVESHLASCPPCCETVMQIKEDTFIELVRDCQTAAGLEPSPQNEAKTGVAEAATMPPSNDTPESPAQVADAATAAGMTCPRPGPTDLPAELVNLPRYRIVELLGKGGMGAVYKAEHRLMQRTVAVKVINSQLVASKSAVERFRREVQAAARLHHPHIVTAHDAEQAGDLHFLVMEYVKGTDLQKVLDARGPLPVAEACDYVRQAALGLQNALENGMVHRDIKPQNLMLTSSGQVKILDFGLASLAAEAASPEGDAATGQSTIDSQKSGLTQAGALMGTPDYMAPEQARDAHAADIRADIYSLGCTLYCLLTGKVPFPGGTTIDKVIAHSERKPQTISNVRKDVPATLLRVLDKMMAKDPAERFQTPAEVGQALAAFTGDAVQSAQQRAQRTVKAPADALIVISLLALTYGLGVGVWLAFRSIPIALETEWFLQHAAAVHVLYAALLFVGGVFMRRLEERNAALCIAFAGIAVPAFTVALTISEAARTPQWPAMAPNWLGAPFALWAAFVLYRRPVREAFARTAEQPGSRTRWIVQTFAKAALFFALAGVVYVITDNGQLVIDCKVKDVKVVVSKGGREYEVMDLRTGTVVKSLISGEYKITLKGDQTDVKLDKDGFTMTRWGQVTVRVTRAPAVAVAPRDQDLVQGAWKLVFVEQDGQRFPAEALAKVPFPTDFVFKDNRWGAIYSADKTFESSFKFTPNENPKWIDVKGSLFGMPDLHGIFKLEGDTFTVCVAEHDQPRPTEFTTKGKRGHMLIVARRVLSQDVAGWVPLFNGKDLTGWKSHPKQPAGWKVDDNGILVGSGGVTSHLFTERGDFEDFHLRAEAKINDHGNSGIYFRCGFGLPRFGTFPAGYEAQILHGPFFYAPGQLEEQLTGSLFSFQPYKKRLILPDEWFTLEVIAQGNRIIIKVNGLTTADYVDEKRSYTKGHFALQQMAPVPKRQPTVVQFRKIEIKEPSFMGGPS